ncbi:hypothetical protein BDC45DRAFT_559725 [Circinella umbellata]|nr:hypothetical protein BDC45DRAFT_559725 [Circinella umbellata]
MPHHQQQRPERDALDRGVLIKGTEEVPATAPIFEGHLYLQHPEKKNRWQWRLFRFDGTSFTCLSTRKIKLPKDTPVDSAIMRQETLLASRSTQQTLNKSQLNTSPSFNTSHTSPLLATPKDKSLRLISLANSMPDLQTTDKQQQQQTTVPPNNNEETVVMASYYQLPKWTVDISNISAISVLKQQSTKKMSPFSTSSNGSKSKCFCVRTFDGECYIMKAQKHKDLERWLFVLTKMWRYAQTIRNQLIQQQQQQQQQQLMTSSSSSLLLHQQPQQRHHYPHQPPQQPSLVQLSQSSPSYRISSKQIWESPPENMHRPVVDVNNTMMMRNLVPPPSFHQPLPPSNNNNTINNNINKGSRSIPSSSLPYDNRYKPPMLSTEKVHWIDQWRESLAELAAYDTSSPPPIEPIPDDDNMSSISGLTSISLREKSTAARKAQQSTMVSAPRRKKSKRSVRSVASAIKRNNNGYDNNTTITSKSNSIAPADASSADILPQELPLDDRPSTSLKKKRSDEVKNWISNNTSNSINPTSPVLVPTPEINFFQDARTILDGDGDQLNDKSVRYHSSIRGRNVRLVEEDQQQQNDNQGIALSPTKIISHRASIIADDQIYGISPLQTLAKAESTDILQQHIDHAKRSSSPALLRHITNPEQQEDEDENMSLADLQRSLRRISMNEQPKQPLSHPSTNRARSPSASSILDRRISTLDQHQHFVQSSKPEQIQHQQHHYNYDYSHRMVSSLPNNTNDSANNNYPSPPTFVHASPSSSSIINNSTTPLPIVAPAVPPMPVVVGGGAPLILPHTPPHQAPPPPRAYYAQPVVSSSELTSKSMHRYPDPSIEQTHYHYNNSHNMEYMKKRPKSWMLPSSTSATSLIPEKQQQQQQQQNLLYIKHSNNSATAIGQHPTTRRSIDVMMDTQRSENNTRW